MSQVLCHLPKFEDPNLIIGFDTSDDAAVYRLNDDTAMIQTVDIFPPVVDDPYFYGQIAAANSISDVYATGGTPTICMNIFAFPENLPKEYVQGILEGGYDKVIEAGAIIAGGHTLQDDEPKYGLCVTGFAHPDKIWANSTLNEGDLLILTKPIGSGVLNTANKAGLLKPPTEKNLIKHMSSLNKAAFDIMTNYKINACTDVTGFGLMGHAYEMAIGSGLTVSFDSGSIPIMNQSLEMAEMGIIPAGAYANRDYLECKVSVSDTVSLALSDLMFDPQTSGGLLFSVSEKDAPKILESLKNEIPETAIVGEVLKKQSTHVILK